MQDPKEHKTIKRLRRYLTTAGIQVQLDKLWIGCKTINQRADRIKELLNEKGIKGKPNLEKCKRLKKKLAAKKEVAELDTSNIITEGMPNHFHMVSTVFFSFFEFSSVVRRNEIYSTMFIIILITQK